MRSRSNRSPDNLADSITHMRKATFQTSGYRHRFWSVSNRQGYHRAIIKILFAPAQFATEIFDRGYDLISFVSQSCRSPLQLSL
jgi:hypothetical protein